MTKSPNILLIMADQLAAPALRMNGNKVCKTPHIERLAEKSVVFDQAYTPAPLCAPARYSMLTGRLGPTIGAYDNASELTASTPTIAHFLRSVGYWTTLCGKMHFIGPDQVHGFDERITTDIYPSSFAWMPNWRKGPSFISSGVTLSSVVEAGPCVRTMQMDYDDEVEYHGLQKIYDLARRPNDQPFFLTISFTNPHTPFTISNEYWERYRPDDIDRPAVPPIPFEDLDYHSKGLFFAHGRNLHDVSDEHLRLSRHGYYGMISYIDDKVGRILDLLDECGLSDDTVVAFVSDHGEMLGERGMWYKHHFWEWSAHVPVLLRLPGGESAGRNDKVVSLIDLAPTLIDIATNGRGAELPVELDGNSLLGAIGASSEQWPDVAISDYLAIGPCTPCRMVRKGAYKYFYTHGHPAQLFNLDDDPHELKNLAGSDGHRDIETELRSIAMTDWNPEALTEKIIESQEQRFLIAEATDGKPTWAFQTRDDDEQRYVRNAKVDDTKGRLRLPYVAPVPFDYKPLAPADVDALMAGKVSLADVRERA